MSASDAWLTAVTIETDSHKDPKIFWSCANGGYERNQASNLMYVYASDDGSGFDRLSFNRISLNNPV